MEEKPKYAIGQTVLWKTKEYTIQGFRDYHGLSWVYDFFPTKDTIVPFHFTGIAEAEITLPREKK